MLKPYTLPSRSKSPPHDQNLSKSMPFQTLIEENSQWVIMYKNNYLDGTVENSMGVAHIKFILI